MVKFCLNLAWIWYDFFFWEPRFVVDWMYVPMLGNPFSPLVALVFVSLSSAVWAAKFDRGITLLLHLIVDFLNHSPFFLVFNLVLVVVAPVSCLIDVMFTTFHVFFPF